MSSIAPSFLPSVPPSSDDCPPKPIGIARMAAESCHSLARNEVDYRWIQCRSTLNRVNGTRVSFEWSINPYRGCEFGCAYCYARYTHEYMNHEDPNDFERIIYMKRHAAELLKRELARGRCPEGEFIAIGGATDPYQPAEKKYEITRSILEVLSRFSGFEVGITSKSDLILRDLDLLRKVAARHRLSINTTVTTTDMKLARILEPRAPTPRRRLDTVKSLNDSGIRSGVILAPIMPGINDSVESLESVVRSAAEANASFFLWQTLFLASSSKKKFDPFLRARFPHLVHRYHQYYDSGIDAPDDYRTRIRATMRDLLSRYRLERPSKLQRRERVPSARADSNGQLDLFA